MEFNLKIGFFDSGLGGLTILKNTINQINANYIYIADNENAPYGIKPKNDVINFTLKSVKNLINLGCEIIVIACNTATSVCINILRNTYSNIHFIGTEPAIKPAVINSNAKHVLVSATSLTLKEEKLQNLIVNLHADNIILKQPLDKLVEFADKYEEIRYDLAYDYLQETLKKYDFTDISGIVLGCTHFPIFKQQFRQVLPPNVEIYDSCVGITNNLKNHILQLQPDYDFNTNCNSLEIILTKDDDVFKNKALNYVYL